LYLGRLADVVVGVARDQVECDPRLAPAGAATALLRVGAADRDIVQRLHATLRIAAQIS
jgi:hypothetical protein